MYTAQPNSIKILVNRGYTLIELLVVMLIIIVVFSVGTVSYRNYQRRQFLEANFRTVLADVRLAQEYALAGRVLDSSICSSNLQGYEFRETSSYEYTITQICNSNRYEYKKVNLNSSGDTNGATINVHAGPGRDGFVFNPLGKGTNSTAAFSCITVSQGGSSKYLRVNTTTGNIEVVSSC